MSTLANCSVCQSFKFSWPNPLRKDHPLTFFSEIAGVNLPGKFKIGFSVHYAFAHQKPNLNCMGHTTQLPDMASTLSMRTAISPEQWQPWTAVSALLGLIRWHSQAPVRINPKVLLLTPFTAEADAKHPFKRQLHPIHVVAVAGTVQQSRQCV